MDEQRGDATRLDKQALVCKPPLRASPLIHICVSFGELIRSLQAVKEAVFRGNLEKLLLHCQHKASLCNWASTQIYCLPGIVQQTTPIRSILASGVTTTVLSDGQLWVRFRQSARDEDPPPFRRSSLDTTRGRKLHTFPIPQRREQECAQPGDGLQFASARLWAWKLMRCKICDNFSHAPA